MLNQLIKGTEYVSFDPGKTTGIAMWKADGGILFTNELKEHDLDEFLESISNYPPKVFIIEEYRIYGSLATAHIGSKVETAQVIGQIKAVARRNNIKIVEQRADILKIASKWAQKPLPKGHPPDWLSAYLHGYYYLHKNGIIKSKLLED